MQSAISLIMWGLKFELFLIFLRRGKLKFDVVEHYN